MTVFDRYWNSVSSKFSRERDFALNAAQDTCTSCVTASPSHPLHITQPFHGIVIIILSELCKLLPLSRFPFVVCVSSSYVLLRSLTSLKISFLPCINIRLYACHNVIGPKKLVCCLNRRWRLGCF